jgi:hypothetical protein
MPGSSGHTILGARGKGETVFPSPRLRFGEATESWLAGLPGQNLPRPRWGYRVPDV